MTANAQAPAQAAAAPVENLLEVRGLKKYFPIHKGLLRRVAGYVKAVDDVNFTVRVGETLGLVGESGCGKSTAGRSIIRLYEPTAGEVLFRSKALGNGQEKLVNMLDLKPEEMKLVRQEISMVFQDPINSLNPRMTVSDIVAEPMIIHGQKEGPETD
ncbi:MAG TPA: ATP-binding cassette domain-containing protein, partial [Anaerolineales bacterium]|nr:ATP-binding cassette domain-containing protein [Anaerolineales bacterium]